MVKLISDYDAAADVLYISLGQPKPAISDEGPDGVLLRRAMDGGEPCGVTVMDYRAGWDGQPGALAKIVADFLGTSETEAATAIHWAVEPS